MREARWAIAEAKGASDAVVGMVGAVPLRGIGILCHLAVHRDYHKLGLGTVLSSWAVSYLRSQGARVVRLDSTRQAESLYRSLGFKPTSRRAGYRLEGAALKAQICVARSQSTREVRLRVTPLVFEDLPELYGVDRWSFGGDRSVLILATLRLRPGWGLVSRDASGRIKGYLIRSTSDARIRIGPFMAAEPNVARTLLSHALQPNRGTSVEISVPGSGLAHELFREFGFVGGTNRLRMELGDAPRAKGLEIYGTTPYLAT